MPFSNDVTVEDTGGDRSLSQWFCQNGRTRIISHETKVTLINIPVYWLLLVNEDKWTHIKVLIKWVREEK